MLINKRLQARWQSTREARLVCFQAPGGFGKTMAARWWTRQTDAPYIEFSLEADPDLQRVTGFLYRLVGELAARSGQSVPGGDVTVETALSLLEDHFAAGLCLLIDDYHLAADAALDGVVAALASRWPPGSAILLCSRKPIALPGLQRLIGRRQAATLTGADLRLDEDETAVYLQVPNPVGAAAYRRTGGWFVPLNVLQDALRIGQTLDAAALVTALQPYLADEVLALLDPEVAQFVRLTAVMESFTEEDCRELGLMPDALERLRRESLLLEATDSGFGYHALIRDAAVASLDPTDRCAWQRTVAAYLFANGREACLPLYIAANDWRNACRAIAWFEITHWLGTRDYQPTLKAWIDLLPGQDLQDDPWYLWLYAITRATSMEPAARLELNHRLLQRFEQDGDALGEMVALCQRARLHWARRDEPALREALPPIRTHIETFPHGGPGYVLGLSLLLDCHLFMAPDPEARALEAKLLSCPHVLPLVPVRQFQYLLCGATAMALAGDVTEAIRYWRLAVALVAETRSYHHRVAWLQAWLSSLTAAELVFDEQAAEAAHVWQADHAYVPAVRQLCVAVRAWLAGQDRVAIRTLSGLFPPGGAACVLDRSEEGPLGRLLLGALHQRQGNLTLAEACYGQAKQMNRLDVVTAEIDWHLAWLAQARGDQTEARTRLQTLERDARQRGHQFLLVRVLLLQALTEGREPPAEARTLISARNYHHALRHHFPEGIAIVGETAPPSHPPQIRPSVEIHTLGGVRLVVNGREVTRRRTNALLILLHLLLNPEGVTARELEQRYWGDIGNPGLRKDIQTLRKLLEPDAPGKTSHFVLTSNARYHWTYNRDLYWWDAAEFEMLCQAATAATTPEARRVAVSAAQALYHGPFAPEFRGWPDVDDAHTRLEAIWRRLEDAAPT
jgi:tetratricopeptide (TPR) repeat protein